MGGLRGRLIDTWRPGASADASRFDEFIRERYRDLVRFLQRRTVSTQDAEDAAQDSIVKLLRYRESVPASDWQRLLYRIAVNAAHDKFRDAQYRHTTAQVAVEDREVPSLWCTPDEFATHEQKLAWLRRAILSLPPKCQRVYLLKLTRDMTNAQIAVHCGISTKMVEKHLATGLATLRQKVGNLTAGTFKGT
ncbi:MAG: RNA polymerase sigma factor [Rhodanobacteraceae bacterium]